MRFELIEYGAQLCVQLLRVRVVLEQLIVLRGRPVAGLSNARYALDRYLFDAVAEA